MCMNDTREKIGPSHSKRKEDVSVRNDIDRNIQHKGFTGVRKIIKKKDCQVKLIVSKLIIQMMKYGRLERKLSTAISKRDP